MAGSPSFVIAVAGQTELVAELQPCDSPAWTVKTPEVTGAACFLLCSGPPLDLGFPLGLILLSVVQLIFR